MQGRTGAWGEREWKLQYSDKSDEWNITVLLQIEIIHQNNVMFHVLMLLAGHQNHREQIKYEGVK